MMLCNHHHDLFAEFFHHFRSSVPLSNNFLFPIFFSCDSNLLSSLCICLFWMFPMRGITYLSFCVCMTSLRMMLLRFKCKVHSLLSLGNFPLHG